MLISKKKHHGFSMIEVLVSLVVIGIGMLGLTGLQLSSVKATNNAHSRNVANMLAMELSDRMRANPAGVMAGAYDNDVNCDTEINFCRESIACSSGDIANFDIQEIMCGMKVSKGSTKTHGGILNLLPSGTLTVQRNTGCDNYNDINKHRITIGWSEAKLDADQRDSDQQQTIEICTLP